MITNGTRATLIGRTWMHLDVPCEGDGYAGCGFVPWNPEHDANAVAELRAFVRARGKVREFCGHILQIVAPTLNIGAFPIERIVDLLDATPTQQTKAFDAVFADDLEKL